MKKAEFEKEFKSLKPASKERVAFVKARNEKMRAQKAAKDERFAMRMNAAALEQLKAAAEKMGIGYTTFLASIAHQYLNGKLVDIEEARKLLNLKVS